MDITDFKNMIRSVSPDQRANIVKKYLLDKIIFNRDDCYSLNEDIMIYTIVSKQEGSLLSITSKLILDSFENLSNTHQEDIKEIKLYNKIFENAYIKTYIPQLITQLTNNNIKFDLYFKEIHFKNGYMNLETKTFEKRKIGKHYITKCISYEYHESKVEKRNELYKEISKIYPNKNVMKTILLTLGSAITGLAVRDSYLLFLIGISSAGKSTILELAKYTTEIYVKQIKPDTFIEGKNTDKIVNTYERSPYIRITWLNEPKDRKFDSTFIKSWSDGECNAEKLYQEGSHDFKHYSITILSANNMPNIQVNEGVQRRVRAYEHTSKFVDDIKSVDEAKHRYLVNKDFKTIFSESIEMKLAFFDILLEYASIWLKDKTIVLPDEFKSCTNAILESNDHIQDFIDGYLEKTKYDGDRIGKNEMLKLFLNVYPNRHITDLQLTQELKLRGIEYDRKKRTKGIQGSFINVQLKQSENQSSDGIYKVNYINQDDKAVYVKGEVYAKLERENILLKEKLNEIKEEKEKEIELLKKEMEELIQKINSKQEEIVIKKQLVIDPTIKLLRKESKKLPKSNINIEELQLKPLQDKTPELWNDIAEDEDMTQQNKPIEISSLDDFVDTYF